MKPETFLSRFRGERASAILRTDDPEKAALAMEAAVRSSIWCASSRIGTT
jgi:hypothetical protein